MVTVGSQSDAKGHGGSANAARSSGVIIPVAGRPANQLQRLTPAGRCGDAMPPNLLGLEVPGRYAGTAASSSDSAWAMSPIWTAILPRTWRVAWSETASWTWSRERLDRGMRRLPSRSDRDLREPMVGGVADRHLALDAQLGDALHLWR